MTPVIEGVDLSKVAVRCAKKKCKTRDFVLHRHHKGHEHMWVSQFIWRLDEPRYVRFVKRYYEYRPSDVVTICSKHHREIHEIYDPIIETYRKKRRKTYRDFSWAEAQELMHILIARCNQWLDRRTKGSDRPWPSNGKTKRRAEDFVRLLLEKPDEFAELVTHQKDDSDIPF